MRKALVLCVILFAVVVYSRPAQVVVTQIGSYIQEGVWTFLQPIQATGGVQPGRIASTALVACNATLLGLEIVTTAANKSAKLCQCTNDAADAGFGAYTWRNLATGTFGTSTTVCGTE